MATMEATEEGITSTTRGIVTFPPSWINNFGWECSYRDGNGNECKKETYSRVLSKEEIEDLQEKDPRLFADGMPAATSDGLRRLVMRNSWPGQPRCDDHQEEC